MRNGTPPVADPHIVALKGLCAGYGEIQVLWGIDLEVHRGEITALIGSNGAGKTTLMRALSGLVPITAGSYVSDGDDDNTWSAGDTGTLTLFPNRAVGNGTATLTSTSAFTGPTTLPLVAGELTITVIR